MFKSSSHFRPSLWLFLCLPFFLQAQSNEEKAIRSSLTSYLDHAQHQNIDGLLDDLYPGVFAILPRDQMKAYFQQFFMDEEVRFRFESMDVTAVSKVLNLDDRAFARVDYALVMTMEYRAAEKDKGVLDMLLENLTSEYGAQNIQMDAANGTFRIQGKKVMLAIRDAPDAGWKVMDYDATLTAFLEQMEIPQEVIQHFSL
ncbi:MAG: hypothetical protein K9I85_04285 [Saprospiraceae bacterium]|nr:hypothetical protein [Saprospiraceae bacterium]